MSKPSPQNLGNPKTFSEGTGLGSPPEVAVFGELRIVPVLVHGDLGGVHCHRLALQWPAGRSSLPGAVVAWTAIGSLTRLMGQCQSEGENSGNGQVEETH